MSSVRVPWPMRKTSFLVALVLLTACNTKSKPTPANFLATLNAWLPDHPDCLLDSSIKFPYETGDATLTRQFDALAKAQILTGTRAPALKITRYTMTDTGLRTGPHLCFGHRVATAIVSSTPPADANGFKETQIVYRYKMEDTPMWAKDALVVSAYPKLAEALSGNATAPATLALTGVGWTVPD